MTDLIVNVCPNCGSNEIVFENKNVYELSWLGDMYPLDMNEALAKCDFYLRCTSCGFKRKVSSLERVESGDEDAITHLVEGWNRIPPTYKEGQEDDS